MKKNIFKIIILVIIDQIIKLIAIGTIGKTGNSIAIIPNFLHLTYFENIGAAFGIFISRIFLIGVDVLLIYVLVKLLRSKKEEINDRVKFGISLVLAGGIGNLIDRIFRGKVIDYIDLTKKFNFPIFNFADVCIFIGVLIIMITIMIITVKKQEKAYEKLQNRRSK